MITFQMGGGVDVRILRRLAERQNILVGHLGGLMHPGKEGEPGVENATLARWLHDGTARIAARPYLLQGLRSKAQEIAKELRRYFVAAASMNFNRSASLNKLGAICVAAVQEFVRGSFYKGNLPNSPSTIRRKGSDTPLIDTGFLINSITWRPAFEAAKPYTTDDPEISP